MSLHSGRVFCLSSRKSLWGSCALPLLFRNCFILREEQYRANLASFISLITNHRFSIIKRKVETIRTQGLICMDFSVQKKNKECFYHSLPTHSLCSRKIHYESKNSNELVSFWGEIVKNNHWFGRSIRRIFTMGCKDASHFSNFDRKIWKEFLNGSEQKDCL